MIQRDSLHIRSMRPWLSPRAAAVLWYLLCVTAAGAAAVFTVVSLARGAVR
jgi:hypothetical protein